MAEQGGEERTEEPTDKRRQQAREKGQVPRSRELGSFMMTLAGAVAFLTMGTHVLNGLMEQAEHGLSISREEVFDTASIFLHMKTAVVETLSTLVPVFLLMVLVAVISSTALSGWVFSTQALAPDLKKLDPIKGLKRVFGWQGLVEMLKGVAKLVLVGSVATLYLFANADAILGLGREPLSKGLAHMGELVGWGFLVASLALVLVAAIDVPFQVWNNKRQLKMTKQEVKDERKQTDGNPEVKGRQRRIQMDMATRRMMEAVPEADVVVTNPTHYAVALKYDQDKMDAPVVVAKGIEAVALNIQKIARGNDVPLLEAPPLARALYHSTELERPIPEGLYRAVAQVLAYVYHLRQGPMYNRGGGEKVVMPDELPIPDELRRDE